MWWAAGHMSTGAFIYEQLPWLWPLVLRAGAAVQGLESIWYQAALFLAGIGWVTYVASRPEPAEEHSLTWMGFRWRVQPDFFGVYKRTMFPSMDELDRFIAGPFCLKCGRLRVRRHWIDEEKRWLNLMTQDCGTIGCGDRVSDSQLTQFPMGLGLDEAKTDTYREAQRRAWNALKFK
jgi:hypothetical protein